MYGLVRRKAKTAQRSEPLPVIHGYGSVQPASPREADASESDAEQRNRRRFGNTC